VASVHGETTPHMPQAPEGLWALALDLLPGKLGFLKDLHRCSGQWECPNESLSQVPLGCIDVLELAPALGQLMTAHEPGKLFPGESGAIFWLPARSGKGRNVQISVAWRLSNFSSPATEIRSRGDERPAVPDLKYVPHLGQTMSPKWYKVPFLFRNLRAQVGAHNFPGWWWKVGAHNLPSLCFPCACPELARARGGLFLLGGSKILRSRIPQGTARAQWRHLSPVHTDREGSSGEPS